MANEDFANIIEDIDEGDNISILTISGVRLSGEVSYTFEQPLSLGFVVDDETKSNIDSRLKELSVVRQSGKGPVIITNNRPPPTLYTEVEKIRAE